MSIFSERLLEARKNANLTQKKLAELLEITPTRLNYWEKGKREPDVIMIKKISQILNVNTNYLIGLEKPDDESVYLSFEAKKLIDKYNKLDRHGKEIIDSTLDIELKRIENQLKNPPTAIQIDTKDTKSIRLPYLDLPASAGTGEPLYDDYNHYEYIYIPDTEPARRADYVIRVNGDSMEDKYYDGDKLLVKAAEYVDLGEIGIFVLNNERYVKKCGNGRLISLNPNYSDIIIGEFDDVRCVGKVIGKL